MMNFLRHYRLRRGFTLIELMIYVAITAMVVVALTQAMMTVLQARDRAERVSELQYGLRFTMDRTVERILRAVSVDETASTLDDPRGTLTLTMAEAENDPSILSLFAGGVFLQQGKHQPEPLTPRSIRIDTLRFQKLGSDRIGITMTGIDPSAGTGSSASMILATSVFLRP